MTCDEPIFRFKSKGRSIELCGHCCNCIREVSIKHPNPQMVCYKCEPHYDNDGLLQFAVHTTMELTALTACVSDGMVFRDGSGQIHIASNAEEQTALDAA